MEDFTEKEVFQLGLVNSKVGRRGRAFQPEVSMCRGRGMKEEPENFCLAEAEGEAGGETGQGASGQNLQGHEWSY